MADLGLLNQIRSKASERRKTIVLPESHDERILKAAEMLTKNNIVKVILLGDEEKVRSDAASSGADLQGVRVIDFLKSDLKTDLANVFFNLRKHKGLTIEQARETLQRDLFFGAMMVREGQADGFVAGSVASTGDVLRAAIQCVGMPEGIYLRYCFGHMA